MPDRPTRPDPESPNFEHRDSENPHRAPENHGRSDHSTSDHSPSDRGASDHRRPDREPAADSELDARARHHADDLEHDLDSDADAADSPASEDEPLDTRSTVPSEPVSVPHSETPSESRGADEHDRACAEPLPLVTPRFPTDEHATSARQLLAHLREALQRSDGLGAAIYRYEQPHHPAEIVVGIGRRVPPLLSRLALETADGSPTLGGRAWTLVENPDPVVLFVSGGNGRPPRAIPEDLVDALRANWLAAPLPRATVRPLVRPPGFDEIIGESSKLIRALQMMAKIAPTQVSVLILGESGTGKELVGRAIHRHSRRKGRFVSENCAALSDTLLEGELFGTEKGAYTGATHARAGLIEEAHGGTLFLDEIGEMGSELQSKLLRVLQEREVRRLGGVDPRPVDFRVVSATHRDLDAQVEKGRFRADLLFRLDVVRVELPPLRERPGDIPILVEHFLADIARQQDTPTPKVDRSAMALLESANWPGNLRELRNELERACALTTDTITPDDLSPRLRHDPIAHTLTQQVLEQLGSDLRRLEKILFGGVIQQVLHESGGNKAEAARRLGIPKTNLYRRLNRYGIPLDRPGV